MYLTLPYSTFMLCLTCLASSVHSQIADEASILMLTYVQAWAEDKPREVGNYSHIRICAHAMQMAQVSHGPNWLETFGFACMHLAGPSEPD